MSERKTCLSTGHGKSTWLKRDLQKVPSKGKGTGPLEPQYGLSDLSLERYTKPTARSLSQSVQQEASRDIYRLRQRMSLLFYRIRLQL